MIIDLARFTQTESPYWDDLERRVDRLERDPGARLDLAEAERFYYLYQRACADLARLSTLSAEPELRRHLETLVARAYGELHDSRRDPTRQARFRPRAWFFGTFPRTVRRRWRALAASLAVTAAGALFGAFLQTADDRAKQEILPEMFSQLDARPSERVARENEDRGRQISGHQSTFSGMLMTNNIRVSLNCVALGFTWGVGTLFFLFYNGLILGLVVCDYVRDGQGAFVAAWLLPHGSVEIPSIILAGQAGFVIASAVLGAGRRERLRARLRAAAPDVVTLVAGLALLLVWAGLVEAFLSQYHEPVVPYAAKIAFGSVELVLLTVFLLFSGRVSPAETEDGALPAPVR